MGDHLTPKVSDRGFRRLPPIQEANGVIVRVYESSAALAPHLWLGIGPPGDAVIHLTAEAAWQLKEQIEWLLEHHYQGDARPHDPIVLHSHCLEGAEFSHAHPDGGIAHGHHDWRWGRIIGEVDGA